MVELARRTADEVFVPFTIGGGLRSVSDAQAVLDAGADKVSVNSAAVARPELIGELAGVFGAQCVVLAIDAKRVGDAAWEVFVAGGRRGTGVDAVGWAREAVERQRLQDVGAAPDAAIQQDLGPLPDRGRDGRQRVERGDRVV